MYQLVACDEDVEWCILVVVDLLPVPELAQCCAFLGVGPVQRRLERGHKARDLLLPVVQCRRGRDHEERPQMPSVSTRYASSEIDCTVCGVAMDVEVDLGSAR